MTKAMLCVIAVLTSSLVVNCTSGAEKPIVVPNVGGHTMQINRVVFSLDGKRLISVGWDWAVHVWDYKAGELERVIRPSTGTGIPGTVPGTIFSAAISPDNKTVAIGVTGEKNVRMSRVVLASLDNGQLDRTLTLPTHFGVLRVEYSKTGRWLAATVGGNVVVWDTDKWEVARQFEGLRDFAFSPDEHYLAIATQNGGRVVSISKGEVALALGKDDTGFVAFSPDYKFIGLVSKPKSEIQIWNARGGLHQTIPTTAGQFVTSLTFANSSDSVLYSQSGLSGSGNEHCAVLWSLDEGKEKHRFTPGGHNFVESVALSPDRQTVAVSSGSGILLWSIPDGRLIRQLRGRARSLYAVGWNRESTMIASGTELEASTPNHLNPLNFAFDLERLEFSTSPQGNFHRAQTRIGDHELRLDDGILVFQQPNQQPAALFRGRTLVRAFTLIRGEIAANSERYGVRIVDYGIWPMPGVTALAPSPDGKYLACSCDNGMVHVISPGYKNSELTSLPLLSLIFADEDWVAFTHEGYYAASSGGERLVGWATEAGPDKLVSFNPASQFRKTLYRPDVIKLLLKAGSVEKALEMADLERGKKSTLVSVEQVLPPKVEIVAPGLKERLVTKSPLKIEAKASSVGEHPVTAMRVLVDGRPYDGILGQVAIRNPRLGEVRESWNVNLTPGKHQIAVQAESAVSKAVSDPIEVALAEERGLVPLPDSKAADPIDLPSLYVLAVGISEYQGKLKLNYANRDAEVLAKTLETSSKALYRKVEVKLLTDRQATRKDILQGLTWLRKQMTQRDVAIVMFAGHGEKDSDGKLYLLPVDVDTDDLLSSAVSSEQIKSTLASIPGKVIVLLDACHAGAADGEQRRASTSLTDDLVRDLVTEDYGVIVMCSAMAREFALEGQDVRHGYFTLAIVEGLSGKADYNKDGVVHFNELDLYATDRVKELAKGRQHPVTAKPTSIRSFPVAKP